MTNSKQLGSVRGYVYHSELWCVRCAIRNKVATSGDAREVRSDSPGPVKFWMGSECVLCGRDAGAEISVRDALGVRATI